jgi:hypothetical protein
LFERGELKKRGVEPLLNTPGAKVKKRGVLLRNFAPSARLPVSIDRGLLHEEGGVRVSSG